MALAAGSQEHHKVFLGWKHCSRQQGACKRTHGHYFRTNCSGTAFGLGGGRRGEQQDRWENASLCLRTRVILFSVGIASGVLIAIPFFPSQLLFTCIQQKILTELMGNRSRVSKQNFSLSQRRFTALHTNMHSLSWNNLSRQSRDIGNTRNCGERQGMERAFEWHTTLLWNIWIWKYIVKPVIWKDIVKLVIHVIRFGCLQIHTRWALPRYLLFSLNFFLFM